MVNRKLVAAREAQGLKQAELASLLMVSTVTISRWENGIQIPRAYYVDRLCQILKRTDHDLGLTLCQNLLMQEIGMVFTEMNRFFTFGKLKTSEIILDGDGTEIFLPQNIRSHYIPIEQSLPEEFQVRKERIEREQEERKANGDSYQWNGERYSLAKFNIGRDPAREDMVLGLWFRPSDYFTFQATNMALQDPKIREKYLADVEFDEAVPLFSHSFSILLTLVTSDGQALLVRRSKGLGCRPNTFDVSIAEGLSRSLDRGATNQAPDVYRCAIRGLAEELGLHAPADYSLDDLTFLSFAVDTEYCMWGLFGMVKLNKSKEEVEQTIQHGVRDSFFENRKVFFTPFRPEDICDFVFTHDPWSPGGLVCLYHSLVHEYGREQVDAAVNKNNN